MRLGRVRVGGWEIIRTRADKKSSNDIRVYKKIKESIKDNVLEHDLIDALSEKHEIISKKKNFVYVPVKSLHVARFRWWFTLFTSDCTARI